MSAVLHAAAKTAVAAVVGPLPSNLAADSADGVYVFGLRVLGYDTAQLGHPAAARVVFESIARKPQARKQLAMDSGSAEGFAKRFPNALPLKVV